MGNEQQFNLNFEETQRPVEVISRLETAENEARQEVTRVLAGAGGMGQIATKSEETFQVPAQEQSPVAIEETPLTPIEESIRAGTNIIALRDRVTGIVRPVKKSDFDLAA